MQIINENEMHERLVEKNAKRRNLLENKKVTKIQPPILAPRDTEF